MRGQIEKGTLVRRVVLVRLLRREGTVIVARTGEKMGRILRRITRLRLGTRRFDAVERLRILQETVELSKLRNAERFFLPMRRRARENSVDAVTLVSPRRSDCDDGECSDSVSTGRCSTSTVVEDPAEREEDRSTKRKLHRVRFTRT